MLRHVKLIALAILLGSCGVTGRGSLCDAEPIRIAQDDVLTRETGTAILRHNLRGRALCGW
jgi:hypothetical protein